MSRNFAGLPIAVGLACLLAGCRTGKSPAGVTPSPARAVQPAWGVRFRDVAGEAGITARLSPRGESPLTALDTANGGGAFLDWNRDGWLDVLVVGQPRCFAFESRKDGTFVEVTQKLGLTQPGRWMGCAVGDWDGDAFPDLLITGYRCLAMYRNLRGARFEDVTKRAGVRTDLWTTSASFADIDRDGDLDLYVGALFSYHVGTRDRCRMGHLMTACGPEEYEPERGALYRNDGRGGFVDITRAAGLSEVSGKTWGCAFGDMDADGWPDLYLANDMVPGDLYRNLGKGKFRGIAAESNTAYDSRGRLMGGMGVDWGDCDGDGRLDLTVTTYYQQPNCLFLNQGEGWFREVSQESGVGRSTSPYVAFGTHLVDVDNDGDLDLFSAAGHVRDNIGEFDAAQSYRQPLQLLENRGDGTFRDVSALAGDPFRSPMVGRGSAVGDYDNDGDSDLLVVDLDGPVRLLKNETGAEQGLIVELVGAGLNREAIGARLTLKVGDRKLHREVTRGRSVLSASDARVHFGLGRTQGPYHLTARWPGGQVSQLPVADRTQRVTLKAP